MTTETRTYELKERAKSKARTRNRIVEATVDLHQEVGPARTTVAEIARRAGVQRLTVYNHFPDEMELMAACQGHFLERHPPPQIDAHLAIPDPERRLAAVLRDFYRWYRTTATMSERVERDRASVEALDSLMAETADPETAKLADALSRGFAPGPRRASRGRVRAAIALGLDFWTWRRLDREGLSDTAAAELMAHAAATVDRAAAGGRSQPPSAA
jgi:AcrR family transcriptional regulator